MRKKYQVFISSTMTDLKEHRGKVIEAMRRAGHIPSYMEDFPSTGQDQMRYIKQMIDDSDIYVLIIGCSYGTIRPGSERGYTELEYDYARGTGKPVLPFYCGNPADLHHAGDGEDWERMEAFKRKVKETLCGKWPAEDSSQLATLVVVSVDKWIRENPGLRGWVRGPEDGQTADTPHRQGSVSEDDPPHGGMTGDGAEESFSMEEARRTTCQKVRIAGNKLGSFRNGESSTFDYTSTLGAMFRLIAGYIDVPTPEEEVKQGLEENLSLDLNPNRPGVYLSPFTWNRIKTKLSTARLIYSSMQPNWGFQTENSGPQVNIGITGKGRKLLDWLETEDPDDLGFNPQDDPSF